MKASTGVWTDLFDKFKDIFDYGCIKVFTGSPPATADAALTGTLLGTITIDGATFVPDDLSANSNGLTFATPANGVVTKTLAENWWLKGVADGTAGYAVLLGNATDAGLLSTSLPRLQLTIGTTSGDLRLTSTRIVTNSITPVTAFSISKPA